MFKAKPVVNKGEKKRQLITELIFLLSPFWRMSLLSTNWLEEEGYKSSQSEFLCIEIADTGMN